VGSFTCFRRPVSDSNHVGCILVKLIERLKAKCLPALYNGLEACPVNKSQIRSSEYVLNNSFRKIFATKSFDVATDCVLYFGCAAQDTLCKRKSKFLTKLKYKTTSNLLNHAVQKVASDELAELQKINYFLSNALSYYLK